MRLFLSVLLGAAALAVASPGTADEEVDKDESTVFNQKKVPPMMELTPDNWEKESKAHQWLMVKHYSPYCAHCKAFAPTYQTLYEFYYTSTPGGSGNENADFSSFYDFRFATVNCIAFYDLCTAHNVVAYPTTTLYKNGEVSETFKGIKDMLSLSEVIETALRSTKPGTRPEKLDLPAPGANSTAAAPAPAPTPAASDAKAAQQPEKAAPKQAETPQANSAAGGKPAEKDAGDAKQKPAVEDNKAKDTAPAKYASVDYNPPAVKPPQLSAPANPHGRSVVLKAESFKTLVTMTQDPWLIKFYAPWCHHCQALAPVWEQLAKQTKDKLNIGEINCEAESRLCKDLRVRGYPMIGFFRGGEHVEYLGLRGLGDLMQYGEKALDLVGGVPDVDAPSLRKMEEKEDVIFIYFYDHATTTEDFMALERLPLNLIGRAKLVKTRDKELYERYKITTWPRLVVSREGRPTYYNPLTPKDLRDVGELLAWMKSVWLPIVPELTASNAREIMDHKMVVLGILNRSDQDGFAAAIREMKSAAHEWMDKQIQLFQLERQELRDGKQLRIEEAEDRGDQRALRAAKSIRINMDKSDRREVSFAWVDGVFWQRWLRTTYGIDVKDGERVIINDEDQRRYWDQTVTGNSIVPSRTSILETLNKVTTSPPKIKAKLTISSFEKVFFDIRMSFSEHPFLTMGCVLGLAFGTASWFRGRVRRMRGGHFRLEDSIRDYKEFKGPLLGGNTNGNKVD